MSVNKPGNESFVTAKWAVVLVTAIWIFTCGSNVPLLLWSDVSTDKSTGFRRCSVSGIDPTARAIQITFVRVVEYIVPLAITWVCYIGLVFRMKTAFKKVRYRAWLPIHGSETTSIYCPGNVLFLRSGYRFM
jgi:hypothetical protein